METILDIEKLETLIKGSVKSKELQTILLSLLEIIDDDIGEVDYNGKPKPRVSTGIKFIPASKK